MHRVRTSVADLRDRRAVPAWNRLRGPGPEGGFPYAIPAQDLQVGTPETPLLLRKALRNHVKASLAWWKHAVVPRANEVKVFFEPTSSVGLRNGGDSNEGNGQKIAKAGQKGRHRC